MENTFTKKFTSLFHRLTKPEISGKRIALRQTGRRILFVFLLIGSSSSGINAQTTYPTLTRIIKPSPEPTAPGDNFTPTMSGVANSSAPQAAEWTRTAGPDESIVLTGVNLSRFTGNDEGKDTRFLVYGRNGVQRDARIQRVEKDKAIITMPKDIPSWSMYLIWPGNEAGYGAPLAINKTDAWWVGPDKATRGQITSVFGRNLAQNNDTLRSYVYIKPAGSAGQWATVTRVNPYKVDFIVPAGLGNGEYEVWAHNGHGGQYGWSGPQKLTVYDGPQWSTTTFNVKNYGATGNGYTDDIAAIQRAMLAAKSSPGATVYFPAGVYMISSNLQAYNNMQLKGDGRDKTIIKCTPNYSTAAMSMVFGVVQSFAMTDMEFNGNNNFRGGVDKPIFLRGSSDIWITNVRFSFANYDIMDLHSCRYVYLNKTEHIGIASFLGDGSQLFIDRNSFKLTNDTDMALHSWSGVGISMTRSTCRDLDNSNVNDGAGWGKGRVFTGNGTWGSNRNTYLGENITTDLTPRPYATDQNSGEQFMWEGNLGQWAGYPSSSTATTTTLPGYSITAQNKLYAVIVKGKGIGQSRRVVANNGGTVTLNEPWNVTPDASSYMVLGHFIDRIAIYNNYLDGKPRAVTSPEHIAAAGIEPFGGALNFIAANNTLHELRQGIANWSTQHYTGLDPNFFSMYTNNKMINCRWGIYNQLILTRPEGTAILGTTYRQNNIQSAALAGIHNSVSTSGQASLDADIYEFNTISNVPQGLTSSVDGVTNMLFYKNNFSAVGGAGITVTPKLVLRENTYQGVSSLYKGGLQGTTIEAPLHVIDMAGVAGGALVTTDFTLKNSTIAAMNWIATSSAPWLTFSSESGTIPDEGCVSLISLNANPAGLPVGTHTATITVTVADQIKKYTVALKLSAAQNGVTITAPAADKIFSATEPINITVTATDLASSVTKVEFFAGLTKIGEDLTSPYAFTWTTATAGSHPLTAKAINSTGLATTLAAVNISVTNNAAPTVSLTSPISAANYAAPASITINANAADTDGTVTKVEFFNGATKIGEDLTSPYNFAWYNVAVGSYIITAKATDNAGTVTTSAPVTVSALTTTVPTVAIVTPGENNTINAPTNVHILAKAELTDGEITRVEFFNGTTKVGDRGHAPFEMYWMNIATGTYTLTAKATGSNGTTATSAPVKLTVVSFGTPVNTAPTVSITSPTATTGFMAPASVTINANATDAGGSVSKVEFYYGNTKVGEDLASPYSFTWNNVSAGSYELTAKATDNAGITTISAPVTIAIATAGVTRNAAPTISLTSPTATTVFTAPASVLVSANAADTDGTISKVEFFNGSAKLGEDLSAPYSFTWINVAGGSYALTARAIDNMGAATNSAPVNININAPALAPVAPTVAITSPTNGLTVTSPANITLTANAADTDGTVTKVEFFNGATKLGEDLTSPYSFTWSNVAAGIYSITAKATDNSGLIASSALIQIVVNTPVLPVAPIVALTSPLTGSSFTTPTSLTLTANASDTDGTISNVAFYNGSTLLGTASASPYSFTWNNVATGAYSLTAIATDNSGLSTTSKAVAVTIATPNAPTVAITSPTNTAIFAAPINLTITANAADTDGRVAKVEFFHGNILLGTSTTSPYSFTWSNMPAGTYTLTAKATDNTGLATTSAAVNITLRTPTAPTVAITAPTSASDFAAPATINVSANATDTDGSIVKVEFYQGTTKLGEDLSSPYTFSWTNVAAGTYTLTAKAFDNSGFNTTSANVNITVKAPAAPTVAITSPVNAATFNSPASLIIAANATDADGFISRVEFYNGTTLLGIATTSPYSFTWNNVPAATYALTAKAFDNTGLFSTSSLVTVSVKAPQAPTVAITAPVNASSFNAPATLTITTSVADADGKVSKVEFYNGTALLGTATASPFSFVWSNVAAGAYTLTAKATDNSGLTTTSSGINVNVVTSTSEVNASNISITSPVAGTNFNGITNMVINTKIATAVGSVKKVEFFANNIKIGEDTSNPFSFTWNNTPVGNHSLTVKATNKSGQTSVSAAVEVTVSNALRTENLVVAGGVGISWEYWLNMPGWHGVSQIPVTTTPSGGKTLTSFATPESIGNNYGARVRGYVIPPTTGTYVFFIAGDDQGDLFLSTSADPNQKKLIAYLSRSTKANDYTKDASQQSKPVTLIAGQRYYIEALHKEGTGNDHLSVGWKLPNGTIQGPIAGTHLMPFETSANGLTALTQTLGAASNVNTITQISASPNPTESRSTIEFTLAQNDDYKLQIYDLKGVLIKTLATGKAVANKAVKVDWEAANLPKGIYNATLTTGSNIKTTRIVLQ